MVCHRKSKMTKLSTFSDGRYCFRCHRSPMYNAQADRHWFPRIFLISILFHCIRGMWLGATTSFALNNTSLRHLQGTSDQTKVNACYTIHTDTHPSISDQMCAYNCRYLFEQYNTRMFTIFIATSKRMAHATAPRHMHRHTSVKQQVLVGWRVNANDD